MMIGRLIQTALISLSSGACLSQAPTFNNDLTKEPNRAVITNEINLRSSEWQRETNTYTEQRELNWNSSNTNQTALKNNPKITVGMANYYNSKVIDNAFKLTVRKVTLSMEVPDYVYSLQARKQLYINYYTAIAYYIEIEPYYRTELLNVTTDSVLSATFNTLTDYQWYENLTLETEGEITCRGYENNEQFNQKITTSQLGEDALYNYAQNELVYTTTGNTNFYEYDDGHEGENPWQDVYDTEMNISIQVQNRSSKVQIWTMTNYMTNWVMNDTEGYEYEYDICPWEHTYSIWEENTTLEITYNTALPTDIPTEPVDIPGMMFSVLTMPFTFISQAFNLTIFAGTPYQINFSNVFLIILTTLILLFVVRILIKANL